MKKQSDSVVWSPQPGAPSLSLLKKHTPALWRQRHACALCMHCVCMLKGRWKKINRNPGRISIHFVTLMNKDEDSIEKELLRWTHKKHRVKQLGFTSVFFLQVLLSPHYNQQRTLTRLFVLCKILPGLNILYLLGVWCRGRGWKDKGQD